MSEQPGVRSRWRCVDTGEWCEVVAPQGEWVRVRTILRVRGVFTVGSEHMVALNRFGTDYVPLEG